ncbi:MULTISPECIES: ABC transporter permease [unclassified Streptomyces]|uniref:ABC transporter permease n=1 Tax=unclassified Streptomyces TaxID=2593676 RepID=UPI00344DFF97
MTTADPQTDVHKGGLGWALSDSWVLTGRSLAHWARNPAPVVIGLLFPIMMVLMFGYLFGGAMQVPGGGDYREFLVPGMFAMTMVFGIEVTMLAVITDASKGVTDRFRAMPTSSAAVVVGRSIADMLNSVLGLAVMILCGLAVGWRAHEGLLDALGAVGLLLLLRFSLLWVGIYLGLVFTDTAAVTAVQTLVWPLGFLSNAFVSPETMPGWLAAISEWNPLSATGTATRELFGNPGWEGTSWASEHAVLLGILWPVVICAIFFPLAVRRYQRLGR